MRGVLAAFPLLVLPAAAWAGANDATVTILSPTAGACVNNGGVVFGGGVLGGMAGAPINPVSVNLRIVEQNGNGTPDPVTVRLDVDGNQVTERSFSPNAEGQAFDTGPIDVFAIEDGANRRITAHVFVGDFEAQQSVVFNLDRLAPTAVADAALPDPSACTPNPPPVQYHLTDAMDAHPTSMERIDTDGCSVRRMIIARDACGNAQEIAVPSRRPPPANSVAVTIGGIAEGARVGTGALTYEITAPNGCVDVIESTLRRDGQVVGPVIHGDPISDAGSYEASVSVGSCGGAPVSATRRFTILQKPVADAGGPYETVQFQAARVCASGSLAPPELGGIRSYQWDINNDGYYDAYEGTTECINFGAALQDGEYTVRVKITAGNGATAEDTATVNITDVSPTCDLVVPNGPFEEGTLVDFDATGSEPGHEEEPIQLYEWHFGDASPDQLAAGLGTTLHRYDAPGDFTYSVTVHDIDSSCTTSGVLHVNDVAPICAGVNVLGAENLYEGMPVQFTAEASPGSFSDPITNYTWNYGDGSAPESGAFTFAPAHAYANQGDYTVRVVVDDPDSQANCPEAHLTVRDLSPVAEIEGPLVLAEGDEAIFQAGDTREGGAADALTRLTWDFGDGSDPVGTAPNVREQRHTFQDDGEFEVTLIARDEDSDAQASVSVIVLDVSPAADFAVAYPDERLRGDEGVPLMLDGSTSVPGSVADPIASYRWDFGDGETAEGPDLVTVEHAWPDNGSYLVRLTVVDEDGSEAVAENTVQIDNVAPTVRIVLEEPTVDVNVPYTYRAEVTDVAGDVGSVDWDMGDEHTYANRREVVHTYTAQGRRVITVTVDDGDGGEATATAAVEISQGRPRFVIGGPYEGVEGEPMVVTFEVNSAEIEPNVYDGPVQVPQPQLPPGALWEELPGAQNEGVRHKTFRITWTPTYVDAGDTPLLLRAQAPSGQVRDREIVVSVGEAGTPYLAAGAVVSGEGRVTVVEYGRDPLNHALSMRPTAEVTVGSGIGGLAASADGRFVFAAVPGSGGVGVVDAGASPPVFGRLIRTGTDCASVAVGGDRLYAVNAGDDSLSVIDATTLKLIRTVTLAPLSRPTDVAFLPAGFDGAAAPRLAIVGGRGGHVILVDPAAAERGAGGAVVAQRRLGGVLQRVVADPETGLLHIADAKTRILYSVRAGALAADAANADVDGVSLDFAARDLSVSEGTLWATTSGGLVEMGGVAAPTFHASELSQTIVSVPASVFPGGGLVLLGGQGLEHVDADLNLVLHTSGRPTTRRLTTYIQLQ